jgi:hypothetical protein
MNENQEQRNQVDQHESSLDHTTRAARQDLQAPPEQTPNAPTVRGNRSAEVGRPWGMTLVN